MTSFQNPKPKKIFDVYNVFQWKTVSNHILEPPLTSMPNLSTVLSKRRTNRKFSPLSNLNHSELLHYTARTFLYRETLIGTLQKKKAVPSAGAIHSIHLLLRNNTGEWFLYDDLTHSLNMLQFHDSLDEIEKEARNCMDIGLGTLFVFVSEVGLVSAMYDNPESLVWRDSGVISGQLGIVSEALGLNCCILGVTGEPYVSSLDDEGRLLGVGMVVIGSN